MSSYELIDTERSDRVRRIRDAIPYHQAFAIAETAIMRLEHRGYKFTSGAARSAAYMMAQQPTLEAGFHAMKAELDALAYVRP